MILFQSNHIINNIRRIFRASGTFVIITFLSLFIFNNSSFADYNTAKVVEHLGKTIPLNLKFVNSEGKQVTLKELVNKPTVLDFCYYRCSGICTPLMAEISNVIGRVKLEPGKDYDIISISIDQNETPAIAARKKRSMVGLINRKIPDSSWTFLTGDSVNIYKLTDAAGFEFKRTIGGFLHKGVLIFVDKNGKICRYVNPGYTSRGDFQILPSDFKMSIMDASKSDVASTIANVLQTCFSFRPKGKDLLVLSLVVAAGLLSIASVLIIIKKANPNKRK